MKENTSIYPLPQSYLQRNESEVCDLLNQIPQEMREARLAEAVCFLLSHSIADERSYAISILAGRICIGS